MMVQLTSKYIEIANSKHGKDENVAHTVAYGLGEFGYLLPKADFTPYLANSVMIIRKAIIKPDAFDEDNLITTENSLGALAKLCYAHMDGTVLTPVDLVSVLNRIPFSSDENESMTTHRLLLDQIEMQGSVVHNEFIKPAAREALNRIKQQIDEEGAQVENRILDAANIQRLSKINLWWSHQGLALQIA